jgi:hypothetical protein
MKLRFTTDQWEGVPWGGAREVREGSLCDKDLGGDGLVGWMLALKLLRTEQGGAWEGGRMEDAQLGVQ